jgi:hypothetical protein
MQKWHISISHWDRFSQALKIYQPLLFLLARIQKATREMPDFNRACG